MQNKNTLVRDLIYVGVFGAVYTILTFIIAFLGYIPIIMPILPMIITMVLSIPVFLFYSKIDRPILCCGLFYGLFGFFYFLSGHSPLFLAIIIVGGFLTGIPMQLMGKSTKSLSISYMISSIIPSSVLLPLWLMTEDYLKMAASFCDQNCVDFLAAMPEHNWVLPAVYAGGVIGAFIGSLIARRAMKKHFKRIGLV